MKDIGQPTILDCTLRDGGYPLDFQFTADDCYRIARGLDAAGIEAIEVGHGLGLNASDALEIEAAESDRTYIEATVSAVADAKVGAFFIPGIGRPEDIEMAADAGADFIRIGQNVTEWDGMADSIRTASEEGLTVCGNLMKSYAESPEAVASRICDLERWGADIGYIVDSAGGMLPEDIKEYVSTTVEAVDNIPIGVHCHDNLEMAIANSLAAIDAGALLVDTTLRGLGRGAGNAATETLATILEKKGYGSKLDQKALMDLSQKEIKPLNATQTTPLDITAGYALFHSKFLTTAIEIADEYDIDPRDLIVEVSKEDVVAPSESLIRRTAKSLSKSGTRSALERPTSYLADSSNIGVADWDWADKSHIDLARQVHIDSRKYSRRGIVSITAGFRSVETPTPTVIHRSNQAVMGNVQVDDTEDVAAVIEDVFELVDKVAVDARLGLDSWSGGETDILRFDGESAIARALTQLVIQQTDRDSIAIVGKHSISHTLSDMLEAHGRQPSVVEPDVSLDDSDVVVAFTKKQGELSSEAVREAPTADLFIDAGIGCFSEPAIDTVRDSDATLLRSDTRAGYVTEIECATITEELLEQTVGSKVLDGIRVVAGGVIGQRGDVVVDSLSDPTRVYGVADGTGGLVTTPSDEERNQIQKIRNKI